MEDRADNLLANDSQAPDRRYEVALAVDADGTLHSLRTDVVDDYGAYFLFAVAATRNAMAQTTGPYAIGSCETRVQGRADQQEPAGRLPRRGLGGQQLGARAAGRRAPRRSSGSTAIELRRRNLIQPDQFPYKIPTGNIYDSGDYPAVLDKALAHAELDFWRAEQARGARAGPLHRHRPGARRSSARPTRSTEFWFHNPGPYVGMSTTPESVRHLASARPAASA